MSVHRLIIKLIFWYTWSLDSVDFGAETVRIRRIIFQVKVQNDVMFWPLSLLISLK